MISGRCLLALTRALPFWILLPAAPAAALGDVPLTQRERPMDLEAPASA